MATLSFLRRWRGSHALPLVVAIFAGAPLLQRATAQEPTESQRTDAEPQASAASTEQEPTSVPVHVDALERQRRLLTLFEGALADTKNGQDFIETSGYRKLVQVLREYRPEDVTERAKTTLDYDAVMKDPDAYRGEFVRVRGVLAGMVANKLDQPVFDLTDVYRGAITDTDGSEGVVFDMVEPPPPVEFRRDLVDIEGIFYRTVRFENRAGDFDEKRAGERVEAPYLLVRNLKLVDESKLPRTGAWSSSTNMIVGLAIVFILVVLIYLFQREVSRRSRKLPPDFRQMFDERHPRRDPKS